MKVSACVEGVILFGWLGGGGEEGEGEGEGERREALSGVYFRQFLPTSNIVEQYTFPKVSRLERHLPTGTI